MKFSPQPLSLAIVALGALTALAPFASVRAETYTVTRYVARRELDLAKLELRHYWQVEYPRQRRELNAAIDLTETEVRNYKERLWQYGPFSRYSTGQPFLLTLQNLRMCLQEAELRLSDLVAERNALIRFHSDDYKLLELSVQEARLRVADIEANDPEARPSRPVLQNP